MSPLTERELAAQEELYARERVDVDVMHSHAAKVVHEEQIQQYFSQLGISQGHDIIGGGYENGGQAGASTRTRTRTNTGGSRSSANRGNALPDSDRRDSTQNIDESLKMFVPRERRQGQVIQDAGVTPLERFLTLGESTDPSYIRRPALIHAQYYGDMGSVETRRRQAQVSAERVISEGQSRKGSTHDGFIGE